MKIVECVPNFSEGREQIKIDQIADAIRSVDGVTLVDVDPGKDTNRTVMTFLGDPDSVVEAAFEAISTAARVIDMRHHSGAHARMGATDVCPFVPVSGVTMQECVELAKRLAARVADVLNIPVYLYEEAAVHEERRNLADIRSGEYEGLEEKLKDPAWKPDYGSSDFNARSGATVIGAREFLIAYNINLNTRDRRKASKIALTIREKGRAKRDQDNKIIRDENGVALRDPGRFKAVKAVGWYMDDFGCAQISMNLVNYRITPPHIVFDECCRLATEMGLRVTGSELVGLIPLEAMSQAGRHYLNEQDKTSGVPQAELIHTAVLSMGLNDLYPFDPRKKIVEYQIEQETPLADLPVSEFVKELSMDSPAPGGGSVAALCGAMSGALSSMVAALTHAKKDYQAYQGEMEQLGVEAQNIKDAFLLDMDRDTKAFNHVLESFRLPKKTAEEKSHRHQAIQQATEEATRVPFEVLARTVKAVELAKQAVETGLESAKSDAAVAACIARAAAEAAYLNVLINLNGIDDKQFRTNFETEAKNMYSQVQDLAQEVSDLALETINQTES